MREPHVYMIDKMEISLVFSWLRQNLPVISILIDTLINYKIPLNKQPKMSESLQETQFNNSLSVWTSLLLSSH